MARLWELQRKHSQAGWRLAALVLWEPPALPPPDLLGMVRQTAMRPPRFPVLWVGRDPLVVL